MDPRVTRHLIAEEGEIIIDEVRRHWMANLGAYLELVLAAVVLVLLFFIDLHYFWVPLAVAALIVSHAWYRILATHMDRFVITNMRVYRVHGIFNQHLATMPMQRILDIAVHKPLIGRIFGYGHFVFESAAQDQGLRDIRFVGRPDERDLTIQRVIQRAGLRGAGAMRVPRGDGT
ncbi:MAG TPA: PH domain-containing protein [Candidatus Avipropionibacterium avicola]|uniref:PH domain-containing protein n=1 Tax=Candidatus Avipropionibacterium avicola TaxID=2840701 RepID=A0A9D1H1P0_9ACTN|nr:PH domain-containing protein [Candidatus Avipropionibacterium avicola]